MMTVEPVYAVVRAPAVPETAPPVVTNPQPWPVLLFIRVARTYIQAFVGCSSIQALASGPVTSLTDVWAVLVRGAAYAIAVAAVSLLQNLGEYLAKIDVKFPALRA